MQIIDSPDEIESPVEVVKLFAITNQPACINTLPDVAALCVLGSPVHPYPRAFSISPGFRLSDPYPHSLYTKELNWPQMPVCSQPAAAERAAK